MRTEPFPVTIVSIFTPSTVPVLINSSGRCAGIGDTCPFWATSETASRILSSVQSGGNSVFPGLPVPARWQPPLPLASPSRMWPARSSEIISLLSLSKRFRPFPSDGHSSTQLAASVLPCAVDVGSSPAPSLAPFIIIASFGGDDEPPKALAMDYSRCYLPVAKAADDDHAGPWWRASGRRTRLCYPILRDHEYRTKLIKILMHLCNRRNLNTSNYKFTTKN